MINLFNKLPYTVEKQKDPDDSNIVILKSVFSQPADKQAAPDDKTPKAP